MFYKHFLEFTMNWIQGFAGGIWTVVIYHVYMSIYSTRDIHSTVLTWSIYRRNSTLGENGDVNH